MPNDTDLDTLAINTIVGLSMDAVQAANSGHPGTPMALAPLGWALFSKLRKHDPARPDWVDRDRFVLSCGHASMLQYSLLHLCGYDLSLEEIKNFRQWGSLTPGHPEAFHTPGVEMTTGPLGQGIGSAVGMAMAERHLAARFNRPGHTIIDHKTWVIASDGDVMEGVAAEAASLAGHLKLGKLIVFWDDNEITIDGRTDLCFGEDVVARFAAYGWHTDSVTDGRDIDAIVTAANAAAADDRPSFVRVKTVIGHPAPNKRDTSGAHGAPLGHDEIAATKEIMGWPAEPFHVPEVLSPVRDDIRKAGADARSGWQKRFEAFKGEFGDEAQAFDRALSGDLPAGWDRDLPTFEPSDKGIATRKASGKVLNALAERLDGLVGGSADLAGSNNSIQTGRANFLPGQEGVPRNVDWGVREHAMGAAINGMALHGGVVPYAATFLIFSDYMRPALRLAALMQLSTRYIFTHDSIGLGEDGPTHQPVEHLSSLRAIPGFAVFRPADANETRECWKAALRWAGPAALVLTRQAVPTIDRSGAAPAEGALRGGYVLVDADGTPDVILIATGSEVALAIEARAALAKDGVQARVVSLPCWELFLAQDQAYRDSVLPPAVKARVAVEAGVRHGWERFVGDHGRYVTLDRFGASAPYKELFAQFGITTERVVEEARASIERAAKS